MTFTVWKREPDGHIGATTYPPKTIVAADKEWSYTILHEFPDWDDARHALLNERGVTDTEAHKGRNCVRCWQEVHPATEETLTP